MSQRTDILGKAPGTMRLRTNGEEKPSFLVARSTKRKLLEELCAAREADSPLQPEDLLPRWPTETATDPDVASLLFEDFRQRRQLGEEPSLQEYEQRFPEHKDSVGGLFRQHDFLRSITGTSQFSGPLLALPSVGDEVFGFRLRRELGAGAFARVFLAEQADLAGRLVVLKTSDTDGDEPQTLAQLQHTHIMPIHSVHEDMQAGLRAVCMPYFGGASLSRVLQKLWSDLTPPSRGEQFVEALDAVGSEREGKQQEQPSGGPQNADPSTPSHARILRLLSAFSYAQTAAWIVARLAEGLQHAHERGVLHRDIKASNILVGADGQPMLLDFNLAHHVKRDQAQAAATLGGTVAYMSPEHLRALATRDPNLVQLVDHRSDIYSLGMVLYEMLTGHNPFDQSGSYSPLPVLMEAMAVERSRRAPSLRESRPDVPWCLESIVCKCLAPDQEQRYQQAQHLADDLKRFLEDQPLQYAPELSQRERLSKWMRRHPRLTSSGTVAAGAALLLIAAGVALAGVREHLAVSQAQDRKRAYEEGTRQALCLLNTTSPFKDYLHQGLAVCEKTLGLYGVLEHPDWQNDPNWQRLAPEEHRRLAEETRELLLLLAGGRVRQAPRDPTVLREALALLNRADAIQDVDPTPSPALWQDRASYLRLLGDSAAADQAQARAEQAPPASAHDHYLLATAYIRKGDHKSAIAELNQAIRCAPGQYWSYFQRGMCFEQTGEYTQAAADFGTCIGLWPEFAWAYFNRGYALHQIGKWENAYEDYSDAIQRDPEFVDAYLNRGLVCLELRRFTNALADYEKAAAHGRDDASVSAGRGIALEGLQRFTEADAAFEAAFARFESAPPDVRRQIRWSYGFAVADRLPEKARQAFDELLKENPNQPEALHGRGMLLMQQHQAEEALSCFTRAVELAPHFIEPRRARAILLARRGNLPEAVREINWCLDQEKSGTVLYGAACVSALAAAKMDDPQVAEPLAEQALTLLQKALEHGYGQDKAATDEDLTAVRDRPEFDRLLHSGVKREARRAARNP
jgi:serine/threonine protein kinase/Flp pilus assembly protein TadD